MTGATAGTAAGAEAGTEDLGWAGRLMSWLRVATHLVGLNVLWLVGTLVGLGVLGAGPATAAASGLLDTALLGRPSEHLVRDFWRAYRRRWLRANALLAPFWVVAVFVVVDLAALRAVTGPVAAVATVAVWVVAAYAAVALAYLVPADERRGHEAGHDATHGTGGVRRTLRLTLLGPALFPLTSVGVVVTVGVTVLLVWVWPVLAPLVGVSLPLALSGRLVRQRLEVLDATPQAGTTDALCTGRVAGRL